jgi:multidrug efflux pump
MKRFTDIFIQRPVLAIVVSLFIFLFGLRAIFDIPVRQYPKIETTVIKVTTAYPGANAELIQGFITTPIQKAIAGADGIDYISSESSQSLSVVEAHVVPNFDPDKAYNDVLSKVSEARRQLPKESEAPIVVKDAGQSFALMYVGFNSTELSRQQITDFISRVVQPKVETVTGVASAEVLGRSEFAMRVWLDPQRMAARQISANEVNNALLQNNFLSAAGQTKGDYISLNVNAQTDAKTIDEFNDIVIRQEDDSLIKLSDIANVELGSASYDNRVTFNGEQATFIAITAVPSANPLNVIADVKKTLPQLQSSFPPSLEMKIVYDATKYIRSALNEVMRTIIEATIIVVIVIFLFLGSLRTVTIPIVAIPLSLVGVCSLMLLLGYSVNLLTLLAMVLAIGIVVDDAIVVVENIYRHVENGEPAYQAAINGAREIAFPVISMTLTLAAVYLPIGLMGGLTGILFKEFAFTLASAVIISGVVALTLSPMMCSKLLTRKISNNRLVQYIDSKFESLRLRYQKVLSATLNQRRVILVFAATVLASIVYLYMQTPKELAPKEDQGVLFFIAQAPEYANSDYVAQFAQEFDEVFPTYPEVEDYFVISGMGNATTTFGGMIFKPWQERERSPQQVQPELQQQLNQLAGFLTFPFDPPALPIGGGSTPVRFEITSTGSYELLHQTMEKMLAEAKKSGMFLFVNGSLKFNKPEIEVHVDRNKAGDLGVSMQDIGATLATFLGESYINRFSLESRSYEVIPLSKRAQRLNPNDLETYYVKTKNGDMVPLATFVTLETTTQPNKLTQFQQLNSVTIEGVPMIGLSLGDALDFLRTTAEKTLPKGTSYDYSGQSRRFVQEGSALLITFFFALITIYLVLAAQFESFRDPLIVLISVPMSICGALIFLNLGLATINIYTQVGLVTLIGLITKHGILMVEFANQLQQEKQLTVRAAIEEAASIRLRPILMTTAATILGVVPLIIATGPGAASRFSIGLVIATGMLIGTLFTLFVVPTIYSYIARDHVKNHRLAIEKN